MLRHPVPEMHSHHATSDYAATVLRPQRRTTARFDTAPTMTLRRDASPASPVDARLSRAPRLGLRPSMARRRQAVAYVQNTTYQPLIILGYSTLSYQGTRINQSTQCVRGNDWQGSTNFVYPCCHLPWNTRSTITARNSPDTSKPRCRQQTSPNGTPSPKHRR